MAEEECLTPSNPLLSERTFTHWSRQAEISFFSRTLCIGQDPDSFNLGTTVWDSSKTLLKYIEKESSIFQQYAKICEIGAGCGGLPSLACAINNNNLSEIVATDIASVIPWLKQNVHENLTLDERDRVHVKEYVWGTSVKDLGGPFDCVLCADVVYEEDYVKPLIQTILNVCHRKSVVYIANERRSAAVHRTFMQHLDQYFHYRIVDRCELDSGFSKEVIEVYRLQPKRRRIPKEMLVLDDGVDGSVVKKYHPFYKDAEGDCSQSGPDPYDCDLWDELSARNAEN